jgi:hypothetical protein
MPTATLPVNHPETQDTEAKPPYQIALSPNHQRMEPVPPLPLLTAPDPSPPRQGNCDIGGNLVLVLGKDYKYPRSAWNRGRSFSLPTYNIYQGRTEGTQAADL